MDTKTQKLSLAERLAAGGSLSIEELALVEGLGRTSVYKEIGAGRLRALKVGRRTIITAEARQEWKARLQSEAA